ncbi:DUF7146 domain-containing protein [Thiomicrorhabdus aquaedulcis]|uniref:DUF7146 domain-containing protein n=1 Tax=Thiomicrorhabdus aquaedulcis TaxID=2211106 RepID=UPI000FDB6245|nr:toprim domain-containing protein [Thiomicrorhabdus aquaedulcis]
MAFFDSASVKTAAANHGWLGILSSICPTLEEATQKVGHHVPCPVNGGKDGFRLFKDAPVSGAGYSNKEGALGDGFAVLKFATGLPFKDVLTLVANHLGMTDEKPLYVQPKPVMQTSSFEIPLGEIQIRRGKLNQFWGQSSTVQKDDRVVQYLRHRGIQGDWMLGLNNVRFHPNAWYRTPNGNQDAAPAMILKFQCPDGSACNIHKTFLSSKTAGKKEMEDAKLMMKPTSKMRGGAVRIGGVSAIVSHDGMLHVSEGFENAATIADIFNQPSWATLNWALLQGFEPPREVRTLVIWCDNDPLDERGHNPGLDAAVRLQKRLELMRPDIKIILKTPPNKKEDWNDLYQAGRIDLFSLEGI